MVKGREAKKGGLGTRTEHSKIQAQVGGNQQRKGSAATHKGNGGEQLQQTKKIGKRKKGKRTKDVQEGRRDQKVRIVSRCRNKPAGRSEEGKGEKGGQEEQYATELSYVCPR